MSLRVVSISLRHAGAIIANWLRPHPPKRGAWFAVGVVRDLQVLGVAIVGRPVPPCPEDLLTAEVTRAWTDGTPTVSGLL